MSRSRKKIPITSWCTVKAGDMKSYKQQENRRLRRAVKQSLHVGEYEMLPHRKEYGDEWISPRDGKCYAPQFGRIDLKKLMRK